MRCAKSPLVRVWGACEIILRVAKCRPRFESLGKSYTARQLYEVCRIDFSVPNKIKKIVKVEVKKKIKNKKNKK